MRIEAIIPEKSKKNLFKSLIGKKENLEEDKELLLSLATVKQNLDLVYMNFEYATDTALIDCYIYELKALQMKYEYLMQKVKARGLQAKGFEHISS